MNDKFFDVEVTMNLVIAVKAKTFQEAEESVNKLPTKELVELINQQAAFLDNNLQLTIKH